MEIPARRIAHTGDGALSVRIRGSVERPAHVFVRSLPNHQVRYPWQPGVESLVLPVLHSEPSAGGLELLVASADRRPMSLQIDEVELVSEVAPERSVELGAAERSATAAGWLASVEVSPAGALGSDAVLVLRLAVEGDGFDGHLRVEVHTDSDGPPWSADVWGVGRGALAVLSLRGLEGRQVDRFVVRGGGDVPEQVLTRSTLRLGREPSSVGEGDGLHLDGAAQGQRADLER